jgi:hypothetical protein
MHPRKFDGRKILKKLQILVRRDITLRIPLIKCLKFDTENRSLQRVESRVPTGFGVLIFRRTTIIPQSPDTIAKRWVIGKHRSSITEGTQILARIEARSCHVSKLASMFSVMSRAMALSSVLNHPNSVS